MRKLPRAGLHRALFALIFFAGAPALDRPVVAAQTFPDGVVRDIRPTQIERGDTLLLECPGVLPGAPATVIIKGLRAGAATVGSLVLEGRGSVGDRVLVDIDQALQSGFGGPLRVSEAGIEVEQFVDGERHAWRSLPGDLFTLDFFPRTFRRLTTTLGDGARAAGGPLARLPLPLLTAVLMLTLALVLHLLIAPVTGLVVVWERKVSGRMQSRLGPNRVGPRGWLQWLADALKLITKEDLIPLTADVPLFRLSPYLVWVGVFAAVVALPLSESAIVADLNIGLLYLISVTSLTVIGILIGGWASNSKWSLLGGMRAAAQIVSYEVPAALALLQIALLAGTLSPQAIVRAQGGLPHQWFLFSNPFTFVCFFIYFIAALAEGNRAPFDLPEADSELVAGYNTEYSGFRFSIFSLAEWTNMYVLGAIASVTFLGGWNIPFVSADGIGASRVLQALSLLVMVAKIVTLVFVIIWIRWTLPRFRIDQMMSLCWKYLVPLALVAFIGTAAWMVLVAAVPLADTLMRGLLFAVGGVGLLAFFWWRVVDNFRRTKLLHLGDKQFTWPFIEQFIDKRIP